jgi:hypothetical protein
MFHAMRRLSAGIKSNFLICSVTWASLEMVGLNISPRFILTLTTSCFGQADTTSIYSIT